MEPPWRRVDVAVGVDVDHVVVNNLVKIVQPPTNKPVPVPSTARLFYIDPKATQSPIQTMEDPPDNLPKKTTCHNRVPSKAPLLRLLSMHAPSRGQDTAIRQCLDLLRGCLQRKLVPPHCKSS
eukprot:3232683-Amphidinium_carterae.1